MDAVWELHVIALAVLHAEMYVKLIEYDEMTVDELERRGLVQSLDAVAAILVGNVTSKYDGLVGFDEIVVTDVADTQPTQCTLERLMAAGIVVALTANRQAVARK
jgi:predicted ATPase